MPIHPTAVVEPGAEVDASAEVGPLCWIQGGARVAAGCRLLGRVTLLTGTQLEERVVVYPGAVLGGDPQDLRFDPAVPSGVLVGSQTVVREGVTVHRATTSGGLTRIGPRCLLMANSHVAHDGWLGEGVVLVNGVLLAGHVRVESFVMLGGGALVHQGCRIGEGAMVGGGAGVGRDVPPFALAAERNRLVGLNLVGLRRRGFLREEIADVKRCFHRVYDGQTDPRKAAAEASAEGVATTPRGRQFLDFFSGCRRPAMRPRLGAPAEEET